MNAAYERNGTPVSAEAFYAIACDPRRHVAVEACAGAGKTWMLVSRILRALIDTALQSPDGVVRPHEILAITFTKKAAGEMRERLEQWLMEFDGADDDTLRRELTMRGVSNADASAEACKALSGLYRAVLAQGRSVQIRTFHGWFAALLRNAPVAVLQRLGLPVNYELLEDDAPARALVWRPFYAAVAADAALHADFDALVSAHGRFQADKALQAALDKRTEFDLADARGVVDASVEHFQVRFEPLAHHETPERALMDAAARDRWLARARALGQEKNKTPQKAAEAVVDAFETTDPQLRLSLLRKGFFVASEDRLTNHLQKYPAAQEAEPELRMLCEASAQHTAWLHQQRMARLTRALIAQYAALKRERGWVDMNDVERAAQVMLSDAVLSGWVQERLDARIRHLMIDEFQDTNPLQWQALSAWLSSYAGAGQAPSVFLVGDPKQSIYRFRRAEPQVFRDAQGFVRERLGGDLLSCDHTRRNSKTVIDTVNAVMTAASQSDGYEGFRPHSTDSKADGEVGCLPVIPRGTESGAESEVTADGCHESDAPPAWRDSLTTPREVPEETLRTLEARQAAAWVAEQMSRGLPPSRIMVLSRRRAGLLPLQDELRALHIPAQVGEKTELIECCEAQDIVALLDVLVSPGHDLSLARALRSPLFGMDDSRLVQLAVLQRGWRDQSPHESHPSWFELLQSAERLGPDSEALRQAGSVLVRWKNWLDTLPPHDALQAIYDNGDVLARFAAAAPPVRRTAVLANLRALLGVSLALDGGRYTTPYGFVRALKAGGTQTPATVSADAVRLLTIHGAKGLEADAVLMLDTDAVERNADSMAVLLDWPGRSVAPEKLVFMVSESRPPACAADLLAADLAARQREELNALYVAMTRARGTLAISSITPHRPNAGSWWQRIAAVAPERPAPTAPAEIADHPMTGTEGSFVLPVLPAPSSPPASAASTTTEDEDSPGARVGKAMHRLLEWGGSLSPAHRAAAAREFRLNPSQIGEAATMASRILAGEGAWAWESERLAWQGNEVDLVHAGTALRLDRLVQRKDAGHEGHWWVLDYKSATAPQRQAALVEQLRNYRQAVQQIYPDAPVTAAFLTGQGALVWVD